LRTFHRIAALVIAVFTLYLSVTGVLIQMVDLRTLFRHSPADDPNMMAIREGIDGPGDFQVIANADYTGALLPAALDVPRAFGTVLGAARRSLGEAPITWAELRMSGARVLGQVRSGPRLLRFDAGTGAALDEQVAKPGTGGAFGDSQRNTIKGLHRLTSIGDWTLWINVLVGTGLCVLLITGLVMYFRLLAARSRIGRRSWFWWAGGGWRSLHRAVSLLSAAFVLVVALSGTWLAIESLGRAINVSHRPPSAGGQPSAETFPPLRDADVPAMLSTTLAAYRRSEPDAGLRVLRLRYYGSMPQGVVITGSEASQVVFNAASGRRVSETEPEYPPSYFPFGWQAHQIAKQIHRGDFIGLPGRWMDLLGGLSMLFLSASGAVMYYDLWSRRSSSGRRALIWR
jgi:uncharacterized iron-regulated membrane protein